MDICNIALFMHDGDTIDIFVCDDTILEDVGPSEDLVLSSSSSFPSSERVENDGVARVQQETDDNYSSIDWTDIEEEGEPIVQQGTEPSIQKEVEPSAQENANEDIDSDSTCSDQSIDYGSDVQEELKIVKENVRKFKESRRRKKKEKTKGFLGEVGLDEGYEDIEKGKKNFKGTRILKKAIFFLKGKLTEDEPYHDNSDCDSFQSDEEEPVSDDELEGGSLRGRKKSNRVIYDSTCDVEFREAVTKYAIKRGVELDKYVNEKCEHRMCARHILTNWSQNFRDIERRKKFWACVRSTFEAQFKYNINALSKLGKCIVEALIKYNKEKWCKAFFQTFSKCDSIDSNMAESFNA
ncbi:hypothetical protein H5410_064929 [Solanum commersonii]|uniref:Transposase MuDR plant domain-containing protein n=1 Tax=Solanum commersonii TaxID=4109 RepID=A0A9J5VY14_SOLCO|nr:hypothetical protein H5410_064929 [Solanum commersonii]